MNLTTTAIVAMGGHTKTWDTLTKRTYCDLSSGPSLNDAIMDAMGF
ncbi:MAG: hypothetical protein IJK49_00465 [Prevotella sp.]|nr:hypothetical protein [Prevotella sp.]